MLRASWILYTTHLWRTLRSRRALLCLVIALVPLVPALLIASLEHTPEELQALAVLWALFVQLVTPLVSLLLGSAVVAEEVDDRTITYLFTRPIPRASVFLGRWLAACTVGLFVVGLGAAAAMAVFATLDGGPHATLDAALRLRLFETLGLGVASYTLLFAALGTRFKYAVILGLAYTFAIEGFLANLPGSGRAITILHHLKSFLAGADPLVRAQLDDLVTGELYEPARALSRLGVAALVLLVVAFRVVTRRQYVLPS